MNNQNKEDFLEALISDDKFAYSVASILGLHCDLHIDAGRTIMDPGDFRLALKMGDATLCDYATLGPDM